MSLGRILILDDEEKMAALIARSLVRSGYMADARTNAEQALEDLKREKYDVLVTDLRMPGLDGLEVLTRAKKLDSEIEVILMTAYASVETVREAMKRGAVDYLEKPISAEDQLKPLLERLLKGNESREEKKAPARQEAPARKSTPRADDSDEPVDFHGILCKSGPMQEIYRKAVKVAKTNASVLLRGESGTGKEVVADLIQKNSNRAAKPYVKINCGALPENLLESELFGHVKGSFTGAVSDRDGMFLTANGGTILLDEIGEVSPALQVKLLRILQQGELNRVGESQTRKVDVRVIAATNRPLEKMIETGLFRQDLYYRLNVVPLVLPPLRDRKEDLEPLVQYFAEKFGEGRPVTFLPDAWDAIKGYSWPGNIRELENAVEHALVLGNAAGVRLDDLPAAVQQFSVLTPLKTGNLSSVVGHASLEEIEKNCLLQALEKTRGNRTRAARILNITRRTLGYRLRKYGLEEEINRRFFSAPGD
ncbi:sigma-54-dependent Fis family transcriptional regulator [Candidatus Sumerlaeota bacterium]|nr:sigma-54-dependent Fis family transcriptional regulator [Candidatus Sumerlaeota bacterium]